MIGMKLQQGVRAIGTTIIALDDGLRDLMKVAPDNFQGTSEQLEGVRRKAIETGKSVARASEDVIQGTAKALQTGISNVDDAMKVAKRTSLYANVSDLQNDVAETHITAIMSAYGGMANSLKPAREQIKGMSKDYSQLQMYTDLANYAGNNFALTSGDVGESLTRSGSMLSSFGVSMSDSIALIVGMQEGVQNAEKTGTALKSIATNLGGVKAAAKDGTMESNKTAKTLKKIAGIDVWNKQTGDVKDMMTTLTELNGVWNDLNKDQKLAISEAVAG